MSSNTSKTKELIHTFVADVLLKHREKLINEGTYGKQFGIVKDRVCFYIDTHFYLNFKYLQEGIDANKPFVKALEGVMNTLDYEDVRTYYYDNIDEFKALIERTNYSTKDVRDEAYVLKMKQGPYFLSIINGHVSAVNMDAATVVDQFLTKELTKKVVYDLLAEKGYEDDFILVSCKHPDLHQVSTF